MVTPSSSSPPTVMQAASLSEVMSAVAERIHYAEGRRTNFTLVAGALLAGGTAVLTAILDKNLEKLISYPATVAAISAIGLGFALLVIYAQQTNRYPWTAATTTWKWFYRDALPNNRELTPKWWSLFCFRSEKVRIQSAYTTQLPIFSAKINALSDAKISLEQDIQQLYVLHVNEKFKNLHLSELRNYFKFGILLIFFLTTIAAAFGALADREHVASRQIDEHLGLLHVTAIWRFVSPSDATQTALVQVTTSNPGPEAADLPKWTFSDEQGRPIPTVVLASSTDLLTVPPGNQLTYSIFVKPAASVPVESLTAHSK